MVKNRSRRSRRATPTQGLQLWQTLGAFTLTASNVVLGAQVLAQDPGLLLDPSTTLVPLPRVEKDADFLKAEVWEGQQRVRNEGRATFKPAEILYGDPPYRSSKQPETFAPRKGSAASSTNALRTGKVIRSGPAISNGTAINNGKVISSGKVISPAAAPNTANTSVRPGKTDVVRSAEMNDALVAHELLSQAKELADQGNLMSAQQLTRQVRELLGEIPAQGLSETDAQRLESLIMRALADKEPGDDGVRTAAKHADEDAVAEAAAHDAGETNTANALHKTTSRASSRPAPLPEMVGEDAESQAPADGRLATRFGTARRVPRLTAIPHSGNRVAFREGIRTDGPSDGIPSGVTLNFDLSSGNRADSAEGASAGGLLGSFGGQAASQLPASVAPRSDGQAVLYFIGGLVLGLFTLCSSLIVFAKLFVPRPQYNGSSEPAPHWMYHLLQQSMNQPFGTAPAAAPQTAPPPVATATAEPSEQRQAPQGLTPRRSDDDGVVTTKVRKPRSNEQRPSTGILEGIFQENLKMQDELSRVAESV